MITLLFWHKLRCTRSSRLARACRKKISNLINSVNTGDDDEEQPQNDSSIRGKVRWLVTHTRFESSMATIIIANALVMGLQADYKIKNEFDESALLRAADKVLSVLFFIELILRIYAEGLHFVSRDNTNLNWNIFDSFIIFCGSIDEIFEYGGFSNDLMDISVMRLLRVLRLARVLRMIRVMRFFRDLRVMIAGIMVSMKSLTWALVVLLLWMYLFAVGILDSLSLLVPPTNQSLAELNLDHFTSLMEALYTLYQCVLGGMDWGDAAGPLKEIQPTLAVAFCLYVAFACLCVLNIVTGVFVENANKLTGKADGEALMEELQSRKNWLLQVRTIFEKAIGANDLDGDGLLQVDEFEEFVDNMQVQAIFRRLGIDLERNHARGLFQLLDFDDRGGIGAEDFIVGVDQLHGQARSIDIIKLLHCHKKVDRRLAEIESGLKAVAKAKVATGVPAPNYENARQISGARKPPVPPSPNTSSQIMCWSEEV